MGDRAEGRRRWLVWIFALAAFVATVIWIDEMLLSIGVLAVIGGALGRWTYDSALERNPNASEARRAWLAVNSYGGFLVVSVAAMVAVVIKEYGAR